MVDNHLLVQEPAAGSQSSYKRSLISWEPIEGATEYHLEIDDDPMFGSPEVDVVVSDTSYILSGEVLELHRQEQWPAYVRINGERWNADTYAIAAVPYAGVPRLGVTPSGEVLYLFKEDGKLFLSAWLCG